MKYDPKTREAVKMYVLVVNHMHTITILLILLLYYFSAFERFCKSNKTSLAVSLAAGYYYLYY